MLFNLKPILASLIVTFLLSTKTVRSIPDLTPSELNLCDRGKSIENSISFFTSKPEYENLRLKEGVKKYLKNSKIIINRDTLLAEEISTRGGSTMLFRRKSYSFTLQSEASFRHDEKRKKLKKFYALSLSMDKNYTCNRIAYELMERIHLFGLFYSFGELNINGESQGICMIIERPEDWAMKDKNAPLIIRRGYNESVDKTEKGKTVAETEIKHFEDYYKSIYKSLRKYKGEELYQQLTQWIDLDNYMKWLAFNFLVRNGDYTDEVFLYIDPEINKFRIIPWDYDDLFLPAPHEGTETSRRVLGDKLIFSSEDELDVKIATDPYLYKIYLRNLKEILDQLPACLIKEVFENTYGELLPYYSKNEVIGMSAWDSHHETSLSILDNDMRSLFRQLEALYNFYSVYLQNLN